MLEFDMKLSKNTPTKDDQMDCDQNATNNDSFYDLGDFTYQPDGSLTIAFTTTDPQSPIHIYKVSLNINSDYTGIEGTCQLTSTINLEQIQQQQAKKTRILFASDDSADTLCVQLEVGKLTILLCFRYFDISSELLS